jgi:hypothetical protein
MQEAFFFLYQIKIKQIGQDRHMGQNNGLFFNVK